MIEAPLAGKTESARRVRLRQRVLPRGHRAYRTAPRAATVQVVSTLPCRTP